MKQELLAAERPLELRLFGPIEVTVRGAPLAGLRSRKGHWLLALLALRRGAEVERSWLAGTLWPEADEEQSRASLRRSLTDLRQALGEEARRLRSPTSRTLALDLEGAWVDVLAFDAAIARGGSLSEAVALYRGPLLEGCAEEWVFEEREARRQALLAALESLAAEALARGEAAEAEGRLALAVTVDPLRESAHRARMEVLAAMGHHAAAVQLYRDLRLRLHRELNAAPDAETTALFERIRADARRERGGEGARGGNGETCPLVHSSPHPLPDPPAALTGAPLLWQASGGERAPVGNLPAYLTRFFGREPEIEALTALLAEQRLVTLTGAGGCGKTRLAVEVGRRLLASGRGASASPGGVWLVELAALSDPALVPNAAAAALGVPEDPGRPIAETLARALGDQDLILIVDNCEHLVAACAGLAESLLHACPRLTLLATSREPLGVAGEVLFRVPSLALPPDPWADPHLLPAYDAVRLFLDRAVAARPSFVLTDRNGRAIADLCRRLDGLPLALELAAALVRAIPVDHLVGRLDDRFRLLTGGSRTALPRQRTLRATMDWSYDLLTRQERAFLQRLSVFASGWTLEAAEAVCADPDRTGEPAGLHTREVLPLLAALVDKSLVLYDEERALGRYRMLESVRQYARERLAESGEEDCLRRRHREYFLRLAEQGEAGLRGSHQAIILDRLEEEQANLRAALDGALERGEAEAALGLCAALADFWISRCRVVEGREHVRRVLALAAPDTNARVLARVLRAAGDLEARGAALDDSRALHERSLALSRQFGDPLGTLRALHGLGHVAYIQGRYEEAERHYEESRLLARSIGDPIWMGESLLRLGHLHMARSRYPEAGRCYEEALSLHRQAGDRIGIGSALYGLGWIAFTRADYETARAHYAEALRVHRELRDPYLMIQSLNAMGTLAVTQSELAEARACYEESLAIGRAVGSLNDAADTRYHLGDLAMREQDYEAARACYEKSLSQYRRAGNRWAMTGTLHGLGQAAEYQGDRTGARARYSESLAIQEELGDWRGAATNLEAMARLWRAEGEPVRAVRLLGAAVALRSAIGAPPLPFDRRKNEQAEEALRAALGEGAFRAAWDAGAALSPVEAIAEARAPPR